MVLTAALTGFVPVSSDRRFSSSPLQLTLLPRFRSSFLEGWLKTIDFIGNVSLCLTRSSVKDGSGWPFFVYPGCLISSSSSFLFQSVRISLVWVRCLSIGTSSKKKDLLAREVMGRFHAQVSSAFNSDIVSVEVLWTGSCSGVFPVDRRLEPYRNRSAGWDRWWLAWWTRVQATPNVNAWCPSRPRSSLGFSFVGSVGPFVNFLSCLVGLLQCFTWVLIMTNPSSEKKKDCSFFYLWSSLPHMSATAIIIFRSYHRRL